MQLAGFGVKRLSEFQPLAELTLDGFVARVVNPVLVCSVRGPAHNATDTMRTGSMSRQRASANGEEELVVVFEPRQKPTPGQPSSTSVGRGPECDVVLPFPAISRQHATLTEDGGGRFFLTDQGSKNGTWINGERLEHKRAYAVNDGDELKFGDVVGTFETPASLYRLLTE